MGSSKSDASESPMTAVMFSRAPGGFTVRFRYDPDVVELIKRTVPGYARSWTRTDKTWFVTADYARLLAAELRTHGSNVHWPTESAKPSIANHHDWARTLLRRVGPQRREPCFRALSKI